MKKILKLDHRKKQSIEAQIYQGLKMYINSTVFLSHDPLPSVDALSLLYKLDAGLFEKAYTQLVNEGYLEKKEQFYHKPEKPSNIFALNQKFYSLTDLAKLLNLESEIETLSQEWVDCVSMIPLDFTLKQGKYLRILRMNTFNQKHKAFITFNIHESFFKNVEKKGFNNESYYDVLKQFYKPDYLSYRYESIVEAKDEAMLRLNLPKKTPILKSYQVVFDEDHQVIAYLELFSAYEIFFTFQRIAYI